MAALTEQAKAEVILDGKKATATIKEMENAVKQLTAEWRQCAAGSQALADKSKEIQQLNTKISDTRVQTKAMTEEMKKGQMNMESLMLNLKEKVMEYGGAVAAIFAVDKMYEYFKGGVEAAIKLKDTENILLQVVDKNKSAQKELIDLAKERAGVTTNSRLEIESAEKFLAIQGRTPEQIRKTISAAQDLSVVTGESLDASVKELNATMEGILSKNLGKLSSQFKELSKDQLYHGDAIDIIAEKYRGLAEDEAKTTEGQVIMAEKSWSALQRTLGAYLLGSGSLLSSVLGGAKSAFDAMSASIAKLNEESKSSMQKFTELGASVAILVNETTPLLTRYDELKSKTVLSADEQGELKKIIEDVTHAMPGASDAFDKYGKAISISSDRVREYIQGQIILLQYNNKKAIKETTDQLADADKAVALNADRAKGRKDTGKLTIASGYHDMDMRPATQEEIAKFDAENVERLNKQIALTLTLKNLKGDALQQSLDIYDKDKKASAEKAEAAKKEMADLKNVTEMSLAELEDVIAKGGVMGANEMQKKLGTRASAELKHRETSQIHAEAANKKIQESYKNLMDSLKVMDDKNYADKFTETQREIRTVEDKYNVMIEKALKYKSDNDKALTTEQKQGVDDQVQQLAIHRDAQVKQVLAQAEQKFADDVALIHENLRVARLSIAARTIFEVTKKYDDARKEITGAIEFAYTEEIKAANGNVEKITIAGENKLAAMAKIKKDIDALNAAENSEKDDARKLLDAKFEETLAGMKLKGEDNLAKGKEKIQLDLQVKYRKLLEENVGDHKKTNEIIAQMNKEQAADEVALAKETLKKSLSNAISAAQAGVNAITSVFSMQNDAENQQLKVDEENNNIKKDNLKKQLDAGVINKTQYDTKVAKLDLEISNKKKKMDHDQAERAKETALFNAMISVASAVAAALTAGPGIGIALSIITAALGAIQIGYILNQKVPQASKGRYSVIGQDDNKIYSDVPLVPSPGTGLVTSPTLISETGSEFVIDPKTTKNLMVNYPHVIDAINYARVPQFGSGNFPQSSSSSTTIQQAPREQDTALLNALKEFNIHARNGTRSYMVYDDFRKADDTMRTIESDVSKK